MDYPAALAAGWPIATGVIEGACRHLVQDRMGITGARWGLDGAQAMLWLRAIAASGDTSTYWHWHIAQEHHRNHLSRYKNSLDLTGMMLTLKEPHPCHIGYSNFTPPPATAAARLHCGPRGQRPADPRPEPLLLLALAHAG